MTTLIEGTESHVHDFDGCMYGLATHYGHRNIPIKKPWRIVSWGVQFQSLMKKCDHKHQHAPCAGRETRVTQLYTLRIAAAYDRDFEQTCIVIVEEAACDQPCSCALRLVAIAASFHVKR